MNVDRREHQSARRSRRYAGNLNLVNARLSLAMLMTERRTLRIAASAGLMALFRYRAPANSWAVTEMGARVSGNADLREDQSHRDQHANPTNLKPLHLRRHGDIVSMILDFPRVRQG